MKKLLVSLTWALAALIALPSLALAQTSAKTTLAVAGYTDAKGAALPGGDTRIDLKSDGKTTTLRLSNLYAYGEAGAVADANGKREAWYGSNKQYFAGGTVYALRLGNDWRGGRTAAQVDLKADDGVTILTKGQVGDNEVVLTFPSRKAGAGVQFDCQPLNYLLVKADGKRAWLGHPGWAQSNNSDAIGDFTGLANSASKQNGDPRFPFGAICWDANGQIKPLTRAMRAEMARTVQPPAGADQATAAAKEQ